MTRSRGSDEQTGPALLWPRRGLVRFAFLRHHDLPVYVAEGYGGRPIEHFPPYRFFSLHLGGQADLAREEFCAWYRRQLDRYGAVAKKLGGMRKGSLHQGLLGLHRQHGIELAADFSNLREDLLAAAILNQVRRRLEVLESIRELGYLPAQAAAVLGVSKGGNVYLTGGHHRAAALKALGHEGLPGVMVVSRVLYNLFHRIGV